jgi:hypothetical protein
MTSSGKRDDRHTDDPSGLDRLKSAVDSVAIEIATRPRRRPSLLRSPLLWCGFAVTGWLAWTLVGRETASVEVLMLRVSGREVQARVVQMDDMTLIVPRIDRHGLATVTIGRTP